MVNRTVPFSMQNTNIVNRLQLKDRLQPNVVPAPENIDELKQLKVRLDPLEVDVRSDLDWLKSQVIDVK